MNREFCSTVRSLITILQHSSQIYNGVTSFRNCDLHSSAVQYNWALECDLRSARKFSSSTTVELQNPQFKLAATLLIFCVSRNAAFISSFAGGRCSGKNVLVRPDHKSIE